MSPNRIILTANGITSNKESNKVMERLSKKKDFSGNTKKDIDKLTEEENIEYDNRSFGDYYTDSLNKHELLGLFIKKSYLKPLLLRMTNLLFCIAMNFLFNAVFYTDFTINETADAAIMGISVNINNNILAEFIYWLFCRMHLFKHCNFYHSIQHKQNFSKFN